MCEVRVPGINYAGAGNSTNKKDSEKNAARDFVSFLIRNGRVNPGEVPGDSVDGNASSGVGGGGGSSGGGNGAIPSLMATANVFKVSIFNRFFLDS